MKLELLDNKHVQDISAQLEKFVVGLASFHAAALHTLDPPDTRPLFPIEMDLSQSAFQYKSTTPLQVSPQKNNLVHIELNVKGIHLFSSFSTLLNYEYNISFLE